MSRWRRTNWPVPVIPGLVTVRKVRGGGLRWGIGPRFLRLHVGGGKSRPGWTIGLGPFMWSTGGERRRS